MTKKLFISHGYLVDDVERKNCWSGTKNDLYGFGDLLACKPKKKPTIIQTTSGSNHLARFKKIVGVPVGKQKVDKRVPANAKFALRSGFRIVVVSWKKRGARWEPRIQEVSVHDF